MIPERLLARSKREGECLAWQGARIRRGYGHVWDPRRKKAVLAHRLMMESILGRELGTAELVDHTCHNPPCFEPSHLRLCTKKQNSENRGGLRSNNTSGFHGVSWHKGKRKWQARVGHGGELHHAGHYPTAEEAAEAARTLRLRLHTHNDLDRSASRTPEK